MSNRPKLHVAKSMQQAEAPAAGPLHVYAIAPRKDGLWGVWCYGCSNDAEQYIYPCRVVQDSDDFPTPPAVLAAPSKLIAMKQQIEAQEERLHIANGSLAHIADQLGLWDNEDDVLNTQDIYEAIEALKGGTT